MEEAEAEAAKEVEAEAVEETDAAAAPESAVEPSAVSKYHAIAEALADVSQGDPDLTYYWLVRAAEQLILEAYRHEVEELVHRRLVQPRDGRVREAVEDLPRRVHRVHLLAAEELRDELRVVHGADDILEHCTRGKPAWARGCAGRRMRGCVCGRWG